MNPSRREAIGCALAALVPSWLCKPAPRPLDLSVFCRRDDHGQWQMDRPFIQGIPEGDNLYRYATDARIILRVPATPRDREEDSDLKLPPAFDLDWSHDARRGWAPLPPADYRLADDVPCPTCDGWGVPQPGRTCERCAGDGCRECGGRGFLGPPCPQCHGNAYGRYPGHQHLAGGVVIAAKYDRLLRQHLGDIEYVPETVDPLKPVLLRAGNVFGLLMPLDVSKKSRT